MPRPPISVVIPCKNEEHHLEDCVASVVQWADEVVIADSGSTDRTLEIATRLCQTFPAICRLVQREFVNYGSFKRWVCEQCRHDWVFVLDADERMTPSLSREIDLALSAARPYDAYSVWFETYFLGNPIRHGSWKHKVVRLFRKSRCQYNTREVHERIDVPHREVKHLVSPLKHFTCTSLERWLQKKWAYAAYGARELAKRGRRTRSSDILFRPIIRFVTSYLLRLGFLDGIPGLIVAIDDAFTTYLKYLKLWESQQNSQSFSSPQESCSTPIATNGQHDNGNRDGSQRLHPIPNSVAEQ